AGPEPAPDHADRSRPSARHAASRHGGGRRAAAELMMELTTQGSAVGLDQLPARALHVAPARATDRDQAAPLPEQRRCEAFELLLARSAVVGVRVRVEWNQVDAVWKPSAEGRQA